MGKFFTWQRVLPVLGIGVLVASAVSLVAGAGTGSAHRGGDWHDNKTKYSLKLDGVSGSGEDGAINLKSYRFVENEKVANGEEPGGQVVTPDDNNLRFLANSSKASPMLMTKAASGDIITDATLTVKKEHSSKGYLVIKLTDVMITSYQNSGNDNEAAIDEVVMSFNTVEMEHNEGTPFRKGWNFKEDKEL